VDPQVDAKGQNDLFEFLAGNWFDRPESDETIAQEILLQEDQTYLQQSIGLAHAFLEGEMPTQEKAAFLRRSVWRSFGEGDEAPLDWLRQILTLLEPARE
jgi:hypothetical protein